MIVLNFMPESATLGEIVIQMLPGGNVAVDRGTSKCTGSPAPIIVYLALQKHSQLARRRPFGTTALMSGEYVVVGYRSS